MNKTYQLKQIVRLDLKSQTQLYALSNRHRNYLSKIVLKMQHVMTKHQKAGYQVRHASEHSMISRILWNCNCFSSWQTSSISWIFASITKMLKENSARWKEEYRDLRIGGAQVLNPLVYLYTLHHGWISNLELPVRTDGRKKP